jgi:hypothetical protein
LIPLRTKRRDGREQKSKKGHRRDEHQINNPHGFLRVGIDYSSKAARLKVPIAETTKVKVRRKTK